MDRAAAVQIPLIDLKAQYLTIKEEVDEAVARVHERGNYVMGEEVEAFEDAWARYCTATHCVACSSGTDAIYLALRALLGDVLERKSVWVPAFTFIGSLEPAFRLKQKIELVDVDDHAVMEKCLPKDAVFDVLLPVHLYGYPVPWVEDAVRVYQYVIEDAAQAHGQPLRGTAACHSFYPSKNLGAMGMAGAVVTNDRAMAQQMRSLRNHGETGGRFRHETLSGNYRMDELQAAILRAKLPHLDDWNAKRRWIARYYIQELQGLQGMKVPAETVPHSWHIFALRCKQRDTLAAYLKRVGIQTAVRYPIPLHLQPALKMYAYTEGDFPKAEAWARENLSLPIFPEMTAEQMEYVVSTVKLWGKNNE